MPNQVVPRELITLAFVIDEYASSGDIVGGLIPIFRPVLHRMGSPIFNPHEFAKTATEYYGIRMNPLAARSLAPKMASFGLLHPEKGGEYKVSAQVASPAFDAVDSSEVDKLLDGFCEFTREYPNSGAIPTKEEEIKKEFLKRVKTVEFLSLIDDWGEGRVQPVLELGDIEKKYVGPHAKKTHAFDFYTARYIERLREKTPDMFQTIRKFVMGVLIVEVVFALGEKPKSANLLQHMSVVLDAPLLLDALDMHTPELHGYAKDLFGMLTRAGIRICVFEHSIEEMRGIIQAGLNNYEKGQPPHRLLSERIRRDQNARVIARKTAQNPRLAVEGMNGLGVEIISAKEFDTPEFHEFCSPKIERNIIGILGGVVQGESIEGKEFDAASVAAILRLRRGGNPTSMVDAKWFFVTRSGSRASQANAFLRVNGLVKPESIAPVLTDRDIGGYLWFSTGAAPDQIKKIATTKLIANCSAATEPSGAILAALRRLMSCDPEKQAALSAIIMDERARTVVADETVSERPESLTMKQAQALVDKAGRAMVAKAVSQKGAEKDAEFARAHRSWDHERKMLRMTQGQIEREKNVLHEELDAERQKSGRLAEEKMAAEMRAKGAKNKAEEEADKSAKALEKKQRQNENRLLNILLADAVKILDARRAKVAGAFGVVAALLGIACAFPLLAKYFPELGEMWAVAGGIPGLVVWWMAAKVKRIKRSRLFRLFVEKSVREQICKRTAEIGFPNGKITVNFDDDNVRLKITPTASD